MRGFILWLACSASLSLLGAERAPDIARGAGQDAVIRAYGWPKGKSVTDGREIWLYENFQVMFEKAAVVSVTYASGSAPKPAFRPVPGPPSSGARLPMPAVSQPTSISGRAANSATHVRPGAADPPSELAPKRPPREATSAVNLPPPSLPATPRADAGATRRWLVVSAIFAAMIVVALAGKRRRSKSRTVAPVPVSPEPAAPTRWQDHVAEKLRTASASTVRIPGLDAGTSTPMLPPPVDEAPVEAFTELTPALLGVLEWKRFEILVELYFRETGVRAERTCIGADGGVDVKLYRPGQERPFSYVQCKAWASWRVDVKAVRELFGVMAADGIAEGVFATTGEFTSEARAFADGKLLLLDGAGIIARFNQLTPVARQRILSAVTEGDYTTPTCPSCDIKMVFRDGGNPSWGCRNFPRCSNTIWVSRAKRSARLMAAR